MSDEQNIEQSQELEIYFEEARRDLMFYIEACDSTYIASKFHRFLASKLQRVEEGKCKRLIISAPPRAGKSRLCAREFPTWYLGKHPEKEIIVAGHTQEFVNDEFSKPSRARIQDEMYQAIFKTRLQDGSANIQTWRTTKRGKYSVAGIGSRITGTGAHLLILDDPIRDFQDAHSEKVLDGIWDWFWSTAYTRLSPDGAVIVIMTRWSEQDPVGRLTDPKRVQELKDSGLMLKEDEWEVVNLPALAESENDPLGRKMGESIFPERWSREKYLSIQAQVGPYKWAGLYRGAPTRLGGNYIKVGMIRTVSPEEVPKDIEWVRAWDLATDEKSHLDYTVGVSAALGPDGTLYIKDVIRGQWRWPESREIIKTTAVAERIPIGIEAIGGFKTAYQNLMEVLPNYILCREYGADKDKLSRANPWIAMVDRGKVAFVNGPWITDAIIELSTFPKSLHDDQVDSISLAYQMISQGSQKPIPVNIYDRFARATASRRERSMSG